MKDGDEVPDPEACPVLPKVKPVDGTVGLTFAPPKREPAGLDEVLESAAKGLLADALPPKTLFSLSISPTILAITQSVN